MDPVIPMAPLGGRADLPSVGFDRQLVTRSSRDSERGHGLQQPLDGSALIVRISIRPPAQFRLLYPAAFEIGIEQEKTRHPAASFFLGPRI
jgi:hypothetical protein